MYKPFGYFKPVGFDGWEQCQPDDDGARALYEAPQWLPIESAPQDGTQVLICGGIYWREFLPLELPSRPFKGSTMAYFDNSLYPKGVWVDGEKYHVPKYWMPLPPPEIEL